MRKRKEEVDEEEEEAGSEADVIKDGEIQMMMGSAADGFVAIVNMRRNARKAEKN